MIKECKVKFKNDVIAVVDYDGVDVQIPSKYIVDDFAYISKENNKYIVSSKDELKKTQKPKRKRTQKTEESIGDVKCEENFVIDNEE